MGKRKSVDDYYLPKKKQTQETMSSDNHEIEGERNSLNNAVVESDQNNTNLPIKDVKKEPNLTPEEKKMTSKKQQVKKESNTLLAMLNASSSDSDDSDDQQTIVKKEPQKSPSKRHSRTTQRLRVSETFTSSDEEKASNKTSRKKLRASQNFDLTEEAKDIEELLSMKEEDDHLPQETMEKMKDLRVLLKHTVPPQHMVESSAGARGPTQVQRETIEKLGPIKYGKYTPEEDNIIVNNWKSFCKDHNWDTRDVKPFLYMRHLHGGCFIKYDQRQKFVQYLANGLPWRTLYSVYWRFRTLYYPHIRTNYTDKEDKLILAHMEKNTAYNEKNVRKFAELAKILNRTRASVWRRYQLLKKKTKSRKKIKWDSRFVKNYIESLMLLTVSDDFRQLKNLDIPLVIWEKLSDKLQVDKNQLRSFWQKKLHMQLFCDQPIYLNDIKIKLIEFFYITGATEWSEIEWPVVAKLFDGMTSAFLCETFCNLVTESKVEGMDLADVIEKLHNYKIRELRSSDTDKCLPRIVFQNGTVMLLDVISKPNRSKPAKDMASYSSTYVECENE